MQRIEIFQILYLWKIVVYNMRDVANVEAARRHRRRHQQRHPSGLEVGQRLFALALQPVSVDGRGGKLKWAQEGTIRDLI